MLPHLFVIDLNRNEAKMFIFLLKKKRVKMANFWWWLKNSVFMSRTFYIFFSNFIFFCFIPIYFNLTAFFQKILGLFTYCELIRRPHSESEG